MNTFLLIIEIRFHIVKLINCGNYDIYGYQTKQNDTIIVTMKAKLIRENTYIVNE